MVDARAESNPFQEVGSLFPGDVEPVCVEPDTPVADALRLMASRRYSQLPVISAGQVRGIFSMWSLTQHLIDAPEVKIQDLTVEDVMDQPLPSVTVEHSLDQVLGYLDQYDAVLVQSPRGIQAVATSTDALNYFRRVAQPYVLLQEIELGLRSLIDACVSDVQLQECINRALSKLYESKKDPLPSSLDKMSFEDYSTMITARDNWEHFEWIFGKNKQLLITRLQLVRTIRNQVMHFREISVNDHQSLVSTRNWLLGKDRARKESRCNQQPETGSP